jgi:hypothetical protein
MTVMLVNHELREFTPSCLSERVAIRLEWIAWCCTTIANLCKAILLISYPCPVPWPT